MMFYTPEVLKTCFCLAEQHQATIPTAKKKKKKKNGMKD